MSENPQKPPEQKPAVNLAGICKSFGNRTILEEISFSLSAGHGLCICGPNASGKTTLLRIIAGLLQSDKGTVEIYGFSVQTQQQKTRPMLGAIFHKSMVYSQLTVQENLEFFAELYGVKNKKECINELLEQTQLTPYRFDKAGILSRGILQRLAIARALIHKPAVLLADEPFAGLDLQASEHLAAVFCGFTKKGGTIVMTTHNVNFAQKRCERAAVLTSGKLKFDKDASELVQDDVLQMRRTV